MIKLRQILAAIVGMVVMIALAGCATTQAIHRTDVEVTHACPHDAKLTSAEALQILDGLPIYLGFNSTSYNIRKVDTIGFSYGSTQTVSDRTEHSGSSIKTYYHYEWIAYERVSFADIKRIKLETDSVGGGDILLYGKKSLINLVGQTKIICGNKPEKYNEILSALLVLCPNVK
jgi:hypothetical protein